MAKTKQLQIPDSETGYSVSTSGTVHTRYAAHAGNVQRTRTADGARTILDGREGSLCQVCFKADDSTETTGGPAPASTTETAAPSTSTDAAAAKTEETAAPSTSTG